MSYPGETSHLNSANRDLSNDAWLVEVREEKLHFTQVHTLCQMEHDEGLFPSLRRVVEFRAKYRQIPERGFGGRQNLETVGPVI